MTTSQEGRIVDLVDSAKMAPKSRSRKDKGKNSPRVPPFTVSYTIQNGDELNPSPSDTLAVLTHEIESAAWEYVEWNLEGRKGKEPLFLEVVKARCHKRLCVQMGLGSCLYFESKEDAVAIMDFYSQSNE